MTIKKIILPGYQDAEIETHPYEMNGIAHVQDKDTGHRYSFWDWLSWKTWFEKS